jgi:hypothetical protein
MSPAPDAHAPADLFGGPFLVTVSSADGPRAQVPDPPFTDAVPVLCVTLEAMPGNPEWGAFPFLHLDLDGNQDAAALVRGERRPGSVLTDGLGLFVHATGNGYVGLEIAETPADLPPDREDPGRRMIRVSIDPAAHAAGLAAAARTGRYCLVHQWQVADGTWRRALLPRTVPREVLEPLVQAALTHPRSIPLGLIPRG